MNQLPSIIISNMQPQQPQPGQGTQPIPQAQAAFQSSAPIGPVAGQYPTQAPAQITMSTATKKHHGGLITTILLVLLLLGASGFGIWAFMERQDYKYESDKKSAQAVEIALAEQKVISDAEFAEKEKLPYDTYTSPATAGSVKVQYPKTWSAQVTEQSNGASPVVGYFHPGFVPSTIGGIDTTAFALRLEVVNIAYDQVMLQIEPFIKQGQVTAVPVTISSAPGVIGIRLSGLINPSITKIQGTMIIFPIRDKTLKIWTESNSAFLNDFDTAVVPNLSFVP